MRRVNTTMRVGASEKMGPRLRGDDNVGMQRSDMFVRGAHKKLPNFVIPAKAGTHLPTRRHAQRGAAMLLAIVLTAITGLMSAGIWQAMHRETSEHYRTERQAAAHHLAEAGLEHALHALSRGLPTPQGEHALGKGHYTVAATQTAPGVYWLESQGLLRDGPMLRARAVLHAEARIAPGGGIASYTLLPGGTP